MRISPLAFELVDLDSSESDDDDQEERPPQPEFTSNERPSNRGTGRTMHERFHIPVNTRRKRRPIPVDTKRKRRCIPGSIAPPPSEYLVVRKLV